MKYRLQVIIVEEPSPRLRISALPPGDNVDIHVEMPIEDFARNGSAVDWSMLVESLRALGNAIEATEVLRDSLAPEDKGKLMDRLRRAAR